MGFFSKICDAIGGPQTVCKSMLNAYDKARRLGYSNNEALSSALQTRYAVIHTIPSSSFPAILAECPDLGTLCLVCVIAENPLRGGENILKTICSIGDFYAKHSPKHAEGLAEVLAIITRYNQSIAECDIPKSVAVMIDTISRDVPLKSLLKEVMSFRS